MNESLSTFIMGGIHPREAKGLTENLAIEIMPLPEQVEIPLLQHFGATCEALVNKKDRVQEGDLIGEVKAGLGANIHASITGNVTNIGSSPGPLSLNIPSITITRDTEARDRAYTPLDWKGLTPQELLQRVKDAGIVGIGGAGFPTHVKLSPPQDAKVDTLILNGAECEPYLTTDHRLMLERPDEIIEGAKILLKILGIKHCYIGIEANKGDAVKILRKSVETQDINGLKL
ncbi:MAG TPA: hypothetical protein VJ373_06035, partial [Desulfatiglandales bacterium]|nr:hypothetical protein [Desulfatiglandales bacterium]